MIPFDCNPMAAMDLRTNQEVMGVQNRYSTEYGSHMFQLREAFEETDIKGNSNFFNSFKTEANSNHSHDSSSLFQVKCSSRRNLEVDNSLFSYHSFKKAMDLRTHNRASEGGKRTIFDDAEYFAKNYCYKLLPITFEQVDETIIQSEHNYSLFSLASESEQEEDCSRMMDYSQIKEKNYKRRRTKFREGSEELRGSTGGDGRCMAHSIPILSATEPECLAVSHDRESVSVQPLDLSAAPLVEEEKTDFSLRGRLDATMEESVGESDEIARLDSDKENLDLELNGIRVTITRPDEIENYQPCDLFLNDIARLVPWLIDKDCFEVDILDRTCDRHDEFRKHRLYYVISEATWLLFQRSNERIILTNDSSLGQPLQKAEKSERPSYLVFDQFSLAKCLAEYCQEIGGCFEYTCVEEGKEEERPERKDAVVKNMGETIKEVEMMEEVLQDFEKTGKEFEEVKVVVEAVDEVKVMAEPVEEFEETSQSLIVEAFKGKRKEIKEEIAYNLDKAGEHKEEQRGMLGEARIPTDRPKEELSFADKSYVISEQVNKPVENVNGEGVEKVKRIKAKKQSPVQPEPKNRQIITRAKSTSELETSQKSDKRVSRKGRRKHETSALSTEEPPNKLKKSFDSGDLYRKTRSGKVLEEAKTHIPAAAKKESSRSVGRGRKEIQARGLESRRGSEEAGGRILRSQRKQDELRSGKGGTSKTKGNGVVRGENGKQGSRMGFKTSPESVDSLGLSRTEMTALLCPLCSQPRFNNLESLRISLLNAATQSISCPICSEVVVGLDKLTIHLFGHTLDQSSEKSHCLELKISKPGEETYSDVTKSATTESFGGQPTGKHDLMNDCQTVKNKEGPNDSDPTVNIEDLSFLTAWENHCKADDSKDSKDLEQIPQECPKEDDAALSDYMSDLLNKKLPVLNFVFTMDTEPKKPAEQSEQFKCSTCEFSFQNSIILSMHQELAHPRSTKESGAFEEVSDEGVVKDFVLPRYNCHLCFKSFQMKGSLLVHYRVAHLGVKYSQSLQGNQCETGEKNFRCSICSKLFKKEQHLTQHIKTHEAKQWQCETCYKHFTTKYFLKKHQRLHTGEMPYSCETCKKTFTFQQSYHKHLLYHSNEKPHRCSQCGRSFKELSTLHNHQRIHSGEKPFACETCGKCFRQRVSYIVHQRIHTGVLPYQCTACKKKFRYKVSQKSHKCTVQPPGVVVRQPGDLIQRILEHRSDSLQCTQ